MQETWVWSLGLEDPLEKGMATHSSFCAWRIPWTEESGGATVHGVAKSWTWLRNQRFLFLLTPKPVLHTLPSSSILWAQKPPEIHCNWSGMGLGHHQITAVPIPVEYLCPGTERQGQKRGTGPLSYSLQTAATLNYRFPGQVRLPHWSPPGPEWPGWMLDMAEKSLCSSVFHGP